MLIENSYLLLQPNVVGALDKGMRSLLDWMSSSRLIRVSPRWSGWWVTVGLQVFRWRVRGEAASV